MTRRNRFTPLAIVSLFCLGLLVRGALAAGAPFANEIQAFETADQKSPPPKNAVLFIGSSSIRMWKSLAQDFSGITVIRRGFGGSQIADSTRYADKIAIPYHPRRIVMYAGDNDIAAGKSPERVLADFKAFVAKIHESLPDVPIDFISIKPSRKRWKLIDHIRKANALVERYANEHKDLGYYDCFTPMLGPDGKPRPELLRADGLHMTPAGYALWTAIIKPRLKQG